MSFVGHIDNKINYNMWNCVEQAVIKAPVITRLIAPIPVALEIFAEITLTVPAGCIENMVYLIKGHPNRGRLSCGIRVAVGTLLIPLGPLLGIAISIVRLVQIFFFPLTTAKIEKARAYLNIFLDKNYQSSKDGYERLIGEAELEKFKDSIISKSKDKDIQEIQFPIEGKLEDIIRERKLRIGTLKELYNDAVKNLAPGSTDVELKKKNLQDLVKQLEDLIIRGHINSKELISRFNKGI